MTYTLIFSNNWEKEYRKIDKIAKERTKNALLKIMESPYSGKPLTGNLRGLWSFRIGKYRIIYNFNEIAEIVYINAIGPRKDIYQI